MFIVMGTIRTCTFNYYHFSWVSRKHTLSSQNYAALTGFTYPCGEILLSNQFNVWLVRVMHFVKQLGGRTQYLLWRILPHLPPLFSWLCSKEQHVETFSLMNNTWMNQRLFLHFNGKSVQHWLCVFALFIHLTNTTSIHCTVCLASTCCLIVFHLLHMI